MRVPSALKDWTREYSFFRPLEASPCAKSRARSVTRTRHVPKTGSRNGRRAGGSSICGGCRTSRLVTNSGHGFGQSGADDAGGRAVGTSPPIPPPSGAAAAGFVAGAGEQAKSASDMNPHMSKLACIFMVDEGFHCESQGAIFRATSVVKAGTFSDWRPAEILMLSRTVPSTGSIHVAVPAIGESIVTVIPLVGFV